MANKKINQLVSKTAILSTDLFGIGDATTGQLFKKTIAELQAAIGGAVISVNGLVGTVVLDTDDIQELATPTNKYFTDARARGAISLTVTGNSGASTYSSGTGVLNVPTYTLAGLGGISATFLSGTSGISYNSTTGVISYSGTVYTDSSIRALLSGSTGISYNSTTGAISYSGTVYTDSSVRALISLTTTGTSGASTYNNTTGVINVPEYTLAGLGGISLTSLSGGTGITYNNTTGAISYSGTVYTDASVRALISASGAVSYNNTTGVISLTSGNLTEATSSVLTITGGTGAVLGSGTSIQVKQATTSVSGFLSSTDWTTFNNKASALSGTTNYVAKFTSSTGIGNSLIYDDGTNVGINTTSPNNFSGYTTLSVNSNTNGGVINTQLNGVNGIRIVTSAGNSSISEPRNLPLVFEVNGSERIRIISTGNILVNTSSNYNLGNDNNKGIIINAGTSYAPYISFRVADVNKGVIYANGAEMLLYAQANIPMIFGTNDTERMRITSGGSLLMAKDAAIGINTADGADNGYLALCSSGVDGPSRGGHIYLSGNERPDDAGSVVIAGGTTSSGAGAIACVLFRTSANERMRITSGGNILLGTTSDNGERLYVSGSIRATGSITANSDIRIKSNITKIENALEKVGQISGYTYNTTYDNKRHGGVIAQEMEKVFPEIVNTGNDGLMGVEYGNISALLIEAIKEQQIQIKELKALLNK